MPRSRRRRVRQRVEWYRSCGILSTSAASTGAIVLPNVEVRDMTSPTIVRVRGSILAHSNGAAPSAEVIAVALIVLPEGTSPTPTPVSDYDADWFMYEQCPSYVSTESTGRFWRVPIDVRAMRRLNEDEEVWLLTERCSTFAYGVEYGLSLLLKQV